MNKFINRIVPFFQERKSRRILTSAAVIVATSGAMAYYWPELGFLGRTLKRAGRTVWHVGWISLDYKWNFPSSTEKQKIGELAWRSKRDKVHYRNAQKLLKLFQLNGGIYIKIGQHLSALEYILPEAYCDQMAILHSQAPTSSLAEVSLVFAKDLGKTLEETFSEFDVEPIGAASLAQVHRAVLKETGEEVAVKVQHLCLKSFVDSDMFVVSCAIKSVKRLFPEFDFDWIADELKINLPKELNFISEAHNAERVQRNFRSSHPDGLIGGSLLRIPKVYWPLTSKRVLTMEYLPGVKATDRKFMLEKGIDPSSVSLMITRVFSEMIFMHGFVHCDPHPGNLLIRLATKSRIDNILRLPWKSTLFELVLLDHGLYRELPDGFRHNYAGLWKAMIDSDEPGMKRFAEAIGGGDAYRLFSCVLTQRSWDSIANHGSIFQPKSAEEAARMMSKASEYFGKIADLLAKIPRHLLLLLKTNDLLRHLERSLMSSSDQPSRTFTTMAHYCIDAVFEDYNGQGKGIFTPLHRFWAHFKIYFIEMIVDLRVQSSRLYNRALLLTFTIYK